MQKFGDGVPNFKCLVPKHVMFDTKLGPVPTVPSSKSLGGPFYPNIDQNKGNIPSGYSNSPICCGIVQTRPPQRNSVQISNSKPWM